MASTARVPFLFGVAAMPLLLHSRLSSCRRRAEGQCLEVAWMMLQSTSVSSVRNVLRPSWVVRAD